MQGAVKLLFGQESKCAVVDELSILIEYGGCHCAANVSCGSKIVPKYNFIARECMYIVSEHHPVVPNIFTKLSGKGQI